MHKRFSLLLLVLLIAGMANAQQKATHPLDPLSAAEIRQTVSLLKKFNIISGTELFNVINLNEPPKQEVLQFTEGQPFRREAFASYYDFARKGISEVIVDLKGEKIVSTKYIPSVIGMGLAADSVVSTIVLSDERWVEALAKRGLTPDSVTHRSIFAGDMGIGPLGHREQMVIARRKNNFVDVEGLVAYTDLTAGKILKIVDQDSAFADRADIDYFKKDSITDLFKGPNPIVITQPEGHSFFIKGHEIRWQNWKLRYGVDNREGLVIYDVRYIDQGKERTVMYRGSMPEMVVPYGSPNVFQAAYNFFDAGAYRLGQGIARSMSPGADAPENAVYEPAILHREDGVPFQMDRAVAIYEEYGGPLWRHNVVSRRATNLVLKYYTMIENYDYGFVWRFKEDGTIEVEIELTGIVEIKGVHRTNEMDPPDKHDLSYMGHSFGTLVRPHVEAINHQHFFVFRLDMDIDGNEGNSVMEMNARAVPEGKANPYGNAFYVEHKTFKKELEAQRNINYESARNWHVINNSVHNLQGQHSGYMLMPGTQAKTLVSAKSPLRKKAGFLAHQFWVTQYNEGEEYPAGMYPVSNKIYGGLPLWTSQNRAISDNDVVLWYVAGITHIVRPEEWPIMSVHRMGFSLMPFGYFSSNPTMGIKNPDFINQKYPKIEKRQADDPELDHQ